MVINYFELSENYRPPIIKTLLIGEAPPPSRKSYFYLPMTMSNKRAIREDRSLPATVFYHYFQKRPETDSEYNELLILLKNKGVFLIDICDDPIRVRDNRKNLERIIGEIPKLRDKMRLRNISVKDKEIIFLLPRPNYLKHLRLEFPDSKYFRWIDFRMSAVLGIQ